MNKHKLHRSGVHQGYYTRQFAVTLKNKSRHAARRQRRKVDHLRRQMIKRLPKNENRIAANSHEGIDHPGMGHQGT